MTRAARLSCRMLAAVVSISIVLSGLPAGAADLGVRGATWPIAEPDLLEEIEAAATCCLSTAAARRKSSGR